MIIAGTGPRLFVPTNSITTLMLELLKERKATDPELTLLSGMAEGWDEFITTLALELELPYHVALPNTTYGDYYWGQHSVTGRNRMKGFERLVANAEQVHVVSEGIYTTLNGRKIHANFARNQWMVDYADMFYVYNPQSKGTADCLRRIKVAHLPYQIITHPVETSEVSS